MKMLRGKVLKTMAVFFAFNIVVEVVAPSVAYALTDGPASPEFTKFEPVATTEMVNPFSGDFTYNLPVLDIPGPDGAGYSLSLSYHSGTSPEEESSWVGYGWGLNPGAINRTTRGFPDDYKDAPVDYYNKSRPNWSAGATADAGVEVFSKDLKNKQFGINASSSLRFNNYQGFQRSKGLGLSIMGMVNLGMNYSAEGVTYSAQVNPMAILNKLTSKPSDKKPENKPVTKADFKKARKEKQNEKFKSKASAQNLLAGLGSGYGIFSFNESSRPTSSTKYTGQSYNYSASLQVNSAVPVGFQIGFAGNVNMQFNDPYTSKNAFGFMNNIEGSGTRQVTDYYVEKGSSYSKRDYFLGIPFNNADNFSVTGEGLGGGFRFYPFENGHFNPDATESSSSSFQAGIEFMVGLNIGIGLDIGLGSQKIRVDNWASAWPNVGSHLYNNQLGGVLRFNNDLGGKIEYSSNNDAQTASINPRGSFPGLKNASLSLPDIYKNMNGIGADDASQIAASAGRSSYIAHTTNAQLVSDPSAAFNKTVNTSDIIHHRSKSEIGSGLAEISVVNEDGNRYIYGLPTYTRNESNIQFDVKNANIVDNYLAYQDVAFADKDLYTPDHNKHQTVIGEVKKTPYAANHLLTQILTTDYVDIGTPGVSDDDFGGWTQFTYHQTYGGASRNNWYRYRTPYTGMMYERNSISDVKDDAASIMTGEKEMYYLKAIETKTHIAFFITNKTTASRFPAGYNPEYLNGSQDDRLDGLGASKELTNDGFELAAQRSAEKGTDRLEYLEKIVVFSKARTDKPVKTTRFSYSYNLVGNLPNNSNGSFPNSKSNIKSGKLTLEKVWFEYEGVINSKISPYVFKYEYKDKDEFVANGEEHLLAEHTSFADLLSRYTKESQNPDYAPHLLDPWGNIQHLGKEQKLKDRAWIYQGAESSTGTKSFDPAAWQLKQIRLPSGGEILIEYEQHEYRYVQNRGVMAMASLHSIPGGRDFYQNPVYIVNTADLGVATKDERDALIDAITAKFKEEKIYFKFLYALTTTVASLDFCKSDYVDGYANLLKAEKANPANDEDLNIRITLEGKTVSGTSGLRYNSPRQACYDFVANQRLGKADDDVGDNCMSSYEEQFEQKIIEIAEKRGPSSGEIKRGMVPEIITQLFEELSSSKYQIPDKESICKTINTDLSYLKLPMLKAKKGGGIRVKTLYMLDHGLESGDAALYGTEYRYETEDGECSGVATNEPSGIRCENPLVTFMPKKAQSWYSKITAGEEKDQTEGPIGESLLPGPSIGYSRIVVKNIHNGPTGTGFEVHEYYTANDYPFDKTYADLGDIDGDLNLKRSEVTGQSVSFTNLEDNTITDHLKLPAIFFSYNVDKVWAAQGYRFVVNSMHGQVKKIAAYGGDYGTDKTYRTSLQEYTYYEPGEKVKVLKPDGTYSLETPGKEMDMAMEIKSMSDNTMDFSIEMDISVTIQPVPPVFFTLWPMFQLNDSRISTHITSKVLRYPVITKRITSYKDGAYNYTENLAFNGATGKPVLTKTTDGFDDVKIGTKKHDGSIYTLTIPASWKYPEMGQMALDPSHTNQLSASTGTIVTYGEHGNLINAANMTWNFDNISAAHNILSANVQTFNTTSRNTTWFSNDVIANYPGLSDNKSKLGGIWRPFQSYVYKAETRSSNKPFEEGANENEREDKIYLGGSYKTFEMFNWARNASQSPNWIKLNEVIKYSPNGNALEEKNVLGIYSAVKYDYSFGKSSNLLPAIIASNAEYQSIAFESYETSATAVPSVAHSGNKSLQYTSGTLTLLSGLISTDQLAKILPNESPETKGGMLKLWLKSTLPTEPLAPEAVINGNNVTMEKVAKTGEWTLFSVALNKSVFPASGTPFTIGLIYPRSGEVVYVDDVRFQPFDSESKCYVYDVSTFKLLTEFDDQHFGLYYQYNSEGKLIRKQIETEKGLKTIQETQYNTPKRGRTL
jgi:hypothetical protein